MLPLFTIALTVAGQVGTADASNVGTQDGIGRPGYQPDKVCGDRLCNPSHKTNVGTQDGIGRPGYQPDKVCGDRLCSEPATTFEAKIIEEKQIELMPPFIEKVDVISASANSDYAFKATYKVHSGDYNVDDLQLLVISDRDVVPTIVTGLWKGDYDTVVIRINAFDKDSIDMKISDWKIHD